MSGKGLSPEASLALLGLSAAITKRWREQLGEPHRQYHDRTHIAAMLAAIWLHDIVYNPRATDNEERSAEQARHDLAGSGLDLDRVAALILATKHHRGDTPQQQLMNDLDLGILGAPPADYARYAAAIRREYAHVSEETYRPARARVLRSFLNLPAIYGGVAFHHLEEPARANMAGEIAGLGGVQAA